MLGFQFITVLIGLHVLLYRNSWEANVLNNSTYFIQFYSYQNFSEKLSIGKDRNLHLSLLDLSDSFDAQILLYIILLSLTFTSSFSIEA